MGRQFFVIAALLIAISGPCFAQGRRGGGGGAGAGRGGGNGLGRSHSMHGNPAMRFSPGDRQMFRRNAERWLRMSPQQQQVLRERERMRQQQIRTEVDAAIRQSGLKLDQRGRQDFEIRYRQERRRVEQELRQESESKRQKELQQLNEQLKKEFQAKPNNASPSASPNK